MKKKRTLAEVPPEEKGTPYAVWKAAELNRIFKEHGLQKQPAKILPSTVEDGLVKYAKKISSQA